MRSEGLLLDDMRVDPEHVVNHREQSPIDCLLEEVQERCLACRQARGAELKEAAHQLGRVARQLLHQTSRLSPAMRHEYAAILLLLVVRHRDHALINGWQSGFDWVEATLSAFRR